MRDAQAHTGNTMTETLDRLIKAIGEGPTEQLLMAFGGTKIHIPADMRWTHPIALRIGTYQAERLLQKIGPGSIELPKYERQLRVKRDQRIRAMAKTKNTNELAILFGLSSRTIRYILSNSSTRRKNEGTPDGQGADR